MIKAYNIKNSINLTKYIKILLRYLLKQLIQERKEEHY